MCSSKSLLQCKVVPTGTKNIVLIYGGEVDPHGPCVQIVVKVTAKFKNYMDRNVYFTLEEVRPQCRRNDYIGVAEDHRR